MHKKSNLGPALTRKPTRPCGWNTRVGKRWALSPKGRAFKEHFLKTGNAEQSAIAAGYSKKTARRWAYLLGARVQASMGEYLRAHSVDERRLSRKIDELLEAKLPRWNKKYQKYQLFEDGAVQLDAVRLAAELIGVNPADSLGGPGSTPRISTQNNFILV